MSEVVEFKEAMNNEKTSYLLKVWHNPPKGLSEEKRLDVGEILRLRGEDIEVPDTLEEKIASIPVVTSPGFEGSNISEYLGLVSGTVVLGTGFLSELSGSVSDFFGTRASGFQDKLTQARNAAVAEMIGEAHDRGAEAVIAVELDHTSVGNNMLVVAAYGTAVKFSGGCGD